MAGNRSPPSSSARPLVPTITLPPRTSIGNIFTCGAGHSPGPMTLVSSFFAENDPENDCRSFSQLLAGAISLPNESQSLEAAESRGGGVEFRFQQNRPAGLVVSQSQGMFTVPPGLSPASLLDSPGFFPSSQGPYGVSHQQILAHVTAQAQAQLQTHIQPQYMSSASHASSLSQLQTVPQNASLQQKTSRAMSDPNFVKESSDISHYDQKSQPTNFTVDKPTDDGYNWRKYGQKQVKGSEYPRSYYKCTHPNCPVTKKVERSRDGQITEIIYKGQHNHSSPTKRNKDAGNVNGTVNLQGSELCCKDHTGNLNTLSTKDQESSQVTPEHVYGSSDSEEVGDAETRVHGKDEEEPESKRRNIEIQTSGQVSSHRTVTEPRIIVQTTSEVDLLDDGYRWRKYGQKVVKGNPHPRSYYKCTNPGCNVRKHVERAASDPKAVVTTYEGKHNHDVPASKNSSHGSSQLRPHNTTVGSQPSNKRTDFGDNIQRPVALLRFKEEQMT